MDNQYNEITFSQIFAIMKKSFKRAIIYVLVSVVLATAILFSTRIFTSYQVSQTTVTFNSDAKISLADLNRNKATAVQNALSELYPNSSDEKFEGNVNGNLNITAVMPSNVKEDSDFTPTSFTLSLKQSNGLNKNQLNALLDKISVELLNTFALSTLPEININNTLENDLQALEYFQIADELYIKAENLSKILNNQLTNATDISKYKNADGLSLNDITANLSAILAKVDNLKTFIVINRVENIGNLEEYLNTKKAISASNALAYKEKAEAAKLALDSFPTPNINGDGNNITSDNSYYVTLSNKYFEYLDLLSDAQNKSSKYENYSTALASQKCTDESIITQTKATLTQLYNELNDNLTSYKDLAKGYNENVYTTIAKVATPAHSNTNSPISITILILVDILVAIIAYLVAFIQVYGKTKNVSIEPLKELDD